MVHRTDAQQREIREEARGRHLTFDWLQERGVDCGPSGSRNFRCIDPAHADTNPSCSYDRARDKVHCFGCGLDEDYIGLLMRFEGLSYPDAIDRAAERLGYSSGASPADAHEAAESRETRENAPTATDTHNERERPAESITAPQTVPFAESDEGTSYLQVRGISVSTAERLGVRFAPEWRHPAAPASVPATARVIVPTSDGCGAAGAYLARAIDDDAAAAEYRKQKAGAQGYAFAEAAARAAQGAPVIVTEGEFDALSVWEAGRPAAALGSCSRAASFAEWWATAHAGVPLLLALDRDAAGARATTDMLAACERLGVTAADVAAEIVPAGLKDPNEALTVNRAEFTRAVAAAGRVIRSLADYIGGGGYRADCELLGSVRGRTWGFTALDAPARAGGLGGMFPGLYVIGGATGLGKTTFVLQVSEHLAETGQGVIYESLEMSAAELLSKTVARRVAAANPAAPWLPTSLEIRLGDLRDGAAGAVAQAMEGYRDGAARNLYVIGGRAGGTSVRDIVADVNAWIGEHPGERPPVVIVDYLQLLVPIDPHHDTRRTVDLAMMELKHLTARGVAVLAVASLNRSSYNQPVTYESFKESGGIEYGADAAFGLQLEDVDSEAALKLAYVPVLLEEYLGRRMARNPRRVVLKVLKNRYGRRDMRFVFDYDPAHDAYTTCAPAAPPSRGEDQPPQKAKKPARKREKAARPAPTAEDLTPPSQRAQGDKLEAGNE